ncbi:MAG TPA: hypothetical protein V6D10_15435 [Trichocoleus sp.]
MFKARMSSFLFEIARDFFAPDLAGNRRQIAVVKDACESALASLSSAVLTLVMLLQSPDFGLRGTAN